MTETTKKTGKAVAEKTEEGKAKSSGFSLTSKITQEFQQIEKGEIKLKVRWWAVVVFLVAAVAVYIVAMRWEVSVEQSEYTFECNVAERATDLYCTDATISGTCIGNVEITASQTNRLSALTVSLSDGSTLTSRIFGVTVPGMKIADYVDYTTEYTDDFTAINEVLEEAGGTVTIKANRAYGKDDEAQITEVKVAWVLSDSDKDYIIKLHEEWVKEQEEKAAEEAKKQAEEEAAKSTSTTSSSPASGNASSSTSSSSSSGYSTNTQNVVRGYCKDGTYVIGVPSASGKANECYGHGGWQYQY